MTNAEKAELASIVACTLHGLVVRRSATNPAQAVQWGLSKHAQVRDAIKGWLDKNEPDAAVITTVRQEGGQLRYLNGTVTTVEISLLDRIRTYLGEKSRRQNVIEEALALEPGSLDGVLTADNGFTVNEQGWVRVMQTAAAT